MLTMAPNITQLTIKFPNHQYPIYIAADLLLNSTLLQQQVLSEQILIVTNDTVAPLYLDKIKHAFSAFQCDIVVLPDGETHKNEHSLFMIYDALISHHHHRDTTLFALGGGVIGDITGFAAATYQRGVRFVQLPTTLLAQVDSAVGGKTGVNYAQAKNMIGSFYQPHAVIMDLSTLATLPERELRAGFAEIIKYGLLVGGSFLQHLVEDGLQCYGLADVVAQCCQIKANFVQRDEREHGQRALLNLGHTFAHALEAITDYGRWLHGEAVAIGLYCAALLSFHLGYLSQSDVDLLDSLLINAKLPNRIPRDIDLQAVYRLMWNDKKIKNKQLPFVIIRSFGDCILEKKITPKQVDFVLQSAVESTTITGKV